MSIAQKSFNLDQIKAQTPLVVHITNNVTINDCANVTLALGASPAMSVEPADAAELASYAGALVINMGLVEPLALEAMDLAGKAARDRGVPIIFDPVAAGATVARRTASRRILEELRPEIVKGNGAEIKFLAGFESQQRGVDSLEDDGVAEAARALALRYGVVVAATGAVDYVSDGKLTVAIGGGTSQLSRVTGTGCMVGSLVGSFAAVEHDYLVAAAQGLLAMKLAGERAVRTLLPGEGTGHFHLRLIDALSLLKAGDFADDSRYASRIH